MRMKMSENSPLYLEKDPETKELYEFFKEKFRLPNFVEKFTITFEINRPLSIEVKYLPLKHTNVN
jgi:hypothetical protein